MVGKQVKISITLPLAYEGDIQTFVAGLVKAMRKKDKSAKVHYSAIEVEDAPAPAARRSRGGVLPMRAQAAQNRRGGPLVPAGVANGVRNSVVYRVTPAGRRAQFNGVRGVIVTYLLQHPNASARDVMVDCHADLGYPDADSARKSVESGLHNLRSQAPAIVESVQA